MRAVSNGVTYEIEEAQREEYSSRGFTIEEDTPKKEKPKKKK